MNKRNIIPIFVPHMGCPHDCIFCNQRKITNFIDSLEKEKLFKYIDLYLTYFKDKNIPIEIAFYGGSFTGLNIDLMIEYLEIANYYISKELVSYIRISTRPDYITTDILDILKKYNVKVIELGIQSLDQEVLNKNERGHTVDSVYRACKLIRDYEISLGLQMMVGLYGDTNEKIIHTTLEICRLQPDFVRVYPTLVIKETVLELLYRKKEYIPMQFEDCINLCKLIYIIFEYNNIDIIRLGLQSSDNISKDGDVVAGPYHPAFKEIVESRVYRDIIMQYVNNNSDNYLTIECSKYEVSKITGNKKSNIIFFKNNFGKVIKFKINNNLNKNIFINDELFERKKYIFQFYNKYIMEKINEIKKHRN